MSQQIQQQSLPRISSFSLSSTSHFDEDQLLPEVEASSWRPQKNQQFDEANHHENYSEQDIEALMRKYGIITSSSSSCPSSSVSMNLCDGNDDDQEEKRQQIANPRFSDDQSDVLIENAIDVVDVPSTCGFREREPIITLNEQEVENDDDVDEESCTFTANSNSDNAIDLLPLETACRIQEVHGYRQDISRTREEIKELRRQNACQFSLICLLMEIT